jgi:cob(I)alamin adenosyltransferase
VKIYTRTGDGGETGLFDGTRVPKSDPRVATYGDVDELNAWLGLARAAIEDRELVEMLERIQRDLFAIGARLADPAHRIAERVTKAAVSADDIARLEQWIDALEAPLAPLRRFVLAGGARGGATLHVARTVCRRAERAMVALEQSGGRDAFEPELLTYVNRLSDLLFVMARAANHRAGIADLEW